MKKFFLLLANVFLLFQVSYSQPIIILDNPSKVSMVGTSVFFLEDKENKLSIEDILQTSYQEQFKNREQETPQFANTTSTIWGKFTVKNTEKTKYLLEIATPLLTNINFYSPTTNGYQIQKVGSILPFASRPILMNNYLFELTTEQDTTQIKTFYIQVNSMHPMTIPIKIGTPTAFMQKTHQEDLGYGIYFGIMVVMALYNLFVFFTLRDKTYLYYVFYVLFVAIAYGTDKGYTNEFLWVNNEYLNFYFPTLISLTGIFIVLFTTSFLHTSIHTPRLHKGFYFWVFIWSVCLVMNIAGKYAWSITLVQGISLFFFLYLFIVAIVNVVYKNRLARYYLLAWSFYIALMVVFTLNLVGIIPSNAFTNNALFFGSAIEVILLSFALADKINVLKKEKEVAQVSLLSSLQENERIILEQNRVLETKVAERTHQLQESNEELNQTVEELHTTNEVLSKINTQLDQQKKEIESKNNDLGEAISELNATNEELSTTNDALGMANEKIAQQSKEVEQAYQNIKILSDIGQQITQTLDLKAVIKMVYENVNQLMDASGFGLGVYDVKLKELAFDGFMEKGKELPFHYHNTLDENYLSIWCFNRQQPIFINDVEKDIKKYIDKEVKISSGEIPQSLLYIPLILEGRSIGVITVQSFEKNAYTETHFGLLQNLAAYCSIAVANANAYKEIDSKNANITKSIEYAQTIQQAILPTQQDLANIFSETFVIYKPKDIVSGDFYWFSQVNQYSFLCVADCTGHGVPGGFMSMIGNAILKDAIDKQEIDNPAQILEYIHVEIRKALKKGETNTSDGMDVSLCRFDTLPNGNLQMIFAGAKSNALYFKKVDGEMLELKGDRQMIGAADNVERKPYTNKVFELQKGDKLYFFTDGFIDQPDRGRNRFGGGKFRDMIKANHHASLIDQHTIYETELANFRDGTEQRDDITLLGFMV
jgi:serine phosphatase RsbU (regulator of sigma subunit)